jgi:hypothetical protein
MIIVEAWASFVRLSEALSLAIAQCENGPKVREGLSNAVWEHLQIYRKLPDLQQQQGLLLAFAAIESIFMELLHSLGGRHNLWDHRYQVAGQNTARFKVVLIYTSDRSVVWVFETINERYAVRLAQAWVQAFEKKDPDTKVKLLAIQKDGTVRDCPSIWQREKSP